MPQPYDIDPTNRLEVARLRTAANRGDQRAQDTLDLHEQQQHTARWEATEQARAEAAAARRDRWNSRSLSVGQVMDKLRHEREDKEARRQSAAEQP